jgi:hypothetical protein
LTARWTVKWTVNQDWNLPSQNTYLLSTLLSIPRQFQTYHIAKLTAKPATGEGASQPADRALKDTSEAASARKFFIDPAVIGFRVLSEVLLSADEINSDIQVITIGNAD